MLPDGNSQILRSYVFGPSGFWTVAPLRFAAKLDPFPSLDCDPKPSTLCPQALHPGAIQGKEGIQFCHLATLQASLPPSMPTSRTKASDEGTGGQTVIDRVRVGPLRDRRSREGRGRKSGNNHRRRTALHPPLNTNPTLHILVPGLHTLDIGHYRTLYLLG